MPRQTRRRRKSRGGRGGAGPGGDLRELSGAIELSAGAADEGVRVRRVQPSEARKLYRCPGCQQEIAVGTGHVVVVPLEAPDLRRHWHTSCWLMRERRTPGR